MKRSWSFWYKRIPKPELGNKGVRRSLGTRVYAGAWERGCAPELGNERDWELEMPGNERCSQSPVPSPQSAILNL